MSRNELMTGPKILDCKRGSFLPPWLRNVLSDRPLSQRRMMAHLNMFERDGLEPLHLAVTSPEAESIANYLTLSSVRTAIIRAREQRNGSRFYLGTHPLVKSLESDALFLALWEDRPVAHSHMRFEAPEQTALPSDLETWALSHSPLKPIRQIDDASYLHVSRSLLPLDVETRLPTLGGAIPGIEVVTHYDGHGNPALD